MYGKKNVFHEREREMSLILSSHICEVVSGDCDIKMVTRSFKLFFFKFLHIFVTIFMGNESFM